MLFGERALFDEATTIRLLFHKLKISFRSCSGTAGNVTDTWHNKSRNNCTNGLEMSLLTEKPNSDLL